MARNALSNSSGLRTLDSCNSILSDFAALSKELKQGTVGEMRPDNPRYQRVIRLWQKLPLAITRFFGPMIVRGIP